MNRNGYEYRLHSVLLYNQENNDRNRQHNLRVRYNHSLHTHLHVIDILFLSIQNCKHILRSSIVRVLNIIPDKLLIKKMNEI